MKDVTSGGRRTWASATESQTNIDARATPTAPSATPPLATIEKA
jgi:hypothetical protein